MKKIISGTLLSAALMLSCATAQAVTDLNRTTPIIFTGVSSPIGAAFGLGTTGQSFTENFTFSQGTVFDMTTATISIALNPISSLDISSFTLSGNGITRAGTVTNAPGLQTWVLNGSNLAAGLYTLAAVGTVTGTSGGAFGGSMSVAPVPEASSMLMMLGGLALVGLVATRKTRRHSPPRDEVAPTGDLMAA